MRRASDVPRQLEILLPGVEADASRERIDLYEDLRARLGLPLMELEATEHGLRLIFTGVPHPLDRESAPLATYHALLQWLLRLEQAWGPLGAAFSMDELGVDVRRGSFAVGPGLFRPCGSDALLRRIESVVLPELDPDQRGLATSFSELTAHLVEAQPELAPAFHGTEGSGGLVRALREAALAAGRRKEPAKALGLWRRALACSPRNRDLLRGVVRAALDCSPGALDLTELHRLERYEPPLWEDAVLAGQARLERGELEEAKRWSDLAVGGAPSQMQPWGLVAKVAGACGDRARLDEALVELAGLGRRPALAALSRRGTSSRSFRDALDRFAGPLDAGVWTWRLDRLLKEERLTGALQLALAHAEWLGELDGELLSKLVEAADRMGGSGSGNLASFARTLEEQERRDPGNHSLGHALAEAFVRLGNVEGLLALFDRSPGAVPRMWWLAALMESGRWKALLGATEGWADGQADDARYRLHALVHLSLPTDAEPSELAQLVPHLLGDPMQRDALGIFLAGLRQVAPGAPVTVQLDTLFREGPLFE